MKPTGSVWRYVIFGKGIPEERLRLLHEVGAESGVGLAGMRERLRELDGQLELESDGCGTSMRATVPLNTMARPLQMEDCGRLGESAQA